MEQKILNSTKLAVDDLLALAQLGKSKLWIDYDQKADVLYINFGKPQKAENSTQEAGLIKRFRNKQIVGITVLKASRFSNKRNFN